jgi:site-specific DNA-cytosine methylase
MTVLKSVDLFSGIGGMQHALRGICAPLLYCDIDPFARAVLRHNMANGRLPHAPIVEDVRDVTSILRIVSKQHVDVLIATSSCKGFSHVGPLSGLRHAESKIILATMEIIAATRPTVVFMENVPGIMTTNGGRDFDRLREHTTKLGYDMRHAVYSASSLGAPHMRKRWYAVCTRRDDPEMKRVLAAIETRKKIASFQWLSRNEPDWHLMPATSLTRKRIRALGNAVVPDCARVAFIELLTFQKLIDDDHKKGATTIVLKSGLVHPPKRPNQTISTRLLHGATLRFFPTPRHANVMACKTLTERCTRDLGTAVRFWTRARGDRNSFTNPQFVEYLMGFPPDWTMIQDKNP